MPSHRTLAPVLALLASAQLQGSFASAAAWGPGGPDPTAVDDKVTGVDDAAEPAALDAPAGKPMPTAVLLSSNELHTRLRVLDAPAALQYAQDPRQTSLLTDSNVQRLISLVKENRVLSELAVQLKQASPEILAEVYAQASSGNPTYKSAEGRRLAQLAEDAARTGGHSAHVVARRQTPDHYVYTSGPTGPTGPTGPAGSELEGLRMLVGATGPTGPAAGPTGPAGPAGPVGSELEQGKRLPAGPAGPAVPAGFVGPVAPASGTSEYGPSLAPLVPIAGVSEGIARSTASTGSGSLTLTTGAVAAIVMSSVALLAMVVHRVRRTRAAIVERNGEGFMDDELYSSSYSLAVEESEAPFEGWDTTDLE